MVADEVLADADVLASLRRNEIVLLATMYKATQSRELGEPETYALKTLVPTPFATEDELRATAAAIGRTGLMIAASGFGAINYELTPLLDRMISYSDLEAVMGAEP